MSDEISKREFEKIARLGGQLDSSKQQQYIDKIKKETAIRAEEIKKEKELAEQLKLKRLKEEEEKETIIPKRIKMAQDKGVNSINSENYKEVEMTQEQVNYAKKDLDVTNKVVESLKEVAKEKPLEPIKPFLPGVKKIKVEEVPSYFLSYPKNAEIYVTPYSADDIDELSNSKLTLKYILTKCLEGVYTNFNKYDITFYDAIYLSYYRRILSIDENIITVTSQCPYCDKYSSREVDINKDIEFEDSKIPKLPINVDFSFGRLSFTYLTYSDFMKLNTNLESEELAYQCINEMPVDKDSDETSVSKLKDLFGSTTGEDLALLKEVKRLTYHGIKPINTLCQNTECGKTFETLINEWDSIILPFRRSKDTIRSKVSFG